MEIKYRMNFYIHWFKNYGYIYTIKNFIKIGGIYDTFRDICVKNHIYEEFEVFFKIRPKNPNRFFTWARIGVMCDNWKIRKGRNYMDSVLKILRRTNGRNS